MDEVWIHDMSTEEWYTQKATGDVPSPRYHSCSVLVPAPDLTSYQIYVFSGATNITGDGRARVLDLYVLSIPAFVWTNIPLDNYPNTYTLAAHACEPPPHSQLSVYYLNDCLLISHRFQAPFTKTDNSSSSPAKPT